MLLTRFLFLHATISALVLPQPSLSYNTEPTTMRAWQCSGRSQKELVAHLTKANIIKTPQVANVMNEVDRQNYIPRDPYADAPQSIGDGQTISAPHMHAHALQEIYPYLANAPGPLSILDVGCGSGFLTACFGRWIRSKDNTSILGKSGRVYGIDIYESLVRLSRNNINKADRDLIDQGVVEFHVANGWEGWPEGAPFDAIHVGAAAEHLPRELAVQLKVGGVMIIPIGPKYGTQYLVKVERVAQQHEQFDPKDYNISNLLGVRYVPLVTGLE